MRMHSLFNSSPDLDIEKEDHYRMLRGYINEALHTPTTSAGIAKVLDNLRFEDNSLYIGADGYIISLGGNGLANLLKYLRQHSINTITCEKSTFNLTGRELDLSGLSINNNSAGSDKHFLNSGQLELSGNNIRLNKTTAISNSSLIIETRSRLSIRNSELKTTQSDPNSYIHLNSGDYQLSGVTTETPNLIINHIIPLKISDALKKGREQSGFLESLPDSPFELEELRGLRPPQTHQAIGINMLPYPTEFNPFRVTYYPAPSSKLELLPRSLVQYSNKTPIIRKQTSDYYIIY